MDPLIPKPRPDADPAYLEKLRSALWWDAERKEIYLQLPSHPNLRIVPYRQGVQDDMVEFFNIHSVGKRLFRLPYPYPKSKADEMVEEGMQEAAEVLGLLANHMQNAGNADTPVPIPNSTTLDSKAFLISPFRVIYDTDLQKAVGDFGIDPHNYHFSETQYTDEEVKAMPRNEQMWDMGYVLNPSHGGKGVMSEVVGVLIESWIKPYMRIGKLGAYAALDNPGSISVLRKNEFVQVGQHTTPWPEEKGGGTEETGRFERNF